MIDKTVPRRVAEPDSSPPSNWKNIEGALLGAEEREHERRRNSLEVYLRQYEQCSYARIASELSVEGICSIA